MSKLDITSLNYLDKIPDEIYQRVITHQYRPSFDNSILSGLQRRVTGILNIMQALLTGNAVSQSSLQCWLDYDLAEIIYIKLTDKQLLKNTFNNPSYTNDILLHVLNWLDHIEDELPQGDKNLLNMEHSVPAMTKQGTQRQNQPDQNQSGQDQSGQGQQAQNQDEHLYNKELNQQLTEADSQALYQSMDDINKSFALHRETGWDLSKAIESKLDVKLLINTHRVIKKSTQIQSIIRLIGRQQTEYVEPHEITGLNQLESNNLYNTIPDDRSINSVTGICYGDDISRMISSELAMLGNSKLKSLWYAKRSERQLLNYHFQGLLSSHVPEIQSSSLNPDEQDKESFKVKGPMILCVDTSASMKGRPESVAKAIALEAMRVARLENRACYLICFSGPNEIIQLELDIHQGWGSIIEFLQLSFNGGTDINNVLLHLLKIQNSQTWRKADILLLSDGRFSIDNQVMNQVNNVTNGMRVFGLQLGKWSTGAFNELCHKVFDLSNA